MFILKEEVINLKVQVSELKNEQLQNNLEISGLPCRSDENCHQIAYSLIKQISGNETRRYCSSLPNWECKRLR